MKNHKEPIMIHISSDGQVIGKMTPSEFRRALGASFPSADFLPTIIIKFNEYKEKSGSSERAKQVLNK